METWKETVPLNLLFDKYEDTVQRLAKRWESDANAYQAQVEEAKAKNLPHDQMMSMMTCLRLCAKDLKRDLSKDRVKNVCLVHSWAASGRPCPKCIKV